MRRLDHSLHAARAFLTFLIWVGGALLVGHALDPERGALWGFLGGGVLFAGRLVLVRWYRRRGDAWVQAGRRLGLRSVYSGQAPGIPIPGYDEPLDLLAGAIGPVTLLVGDRAERFLQHHRPAPVGTWETSEPEVSDPIPMETFVAAWIPGLDEEAFCLGRRRSLFEARPTPRPGGSAAAEALASWARQNPRWRIEGQGACIVLSRPHRLARVEELGDWIEAVRSLVDGVRA